MQEPFRSRRDVAWGRSPPSPNLATSSSRPGPLTVAASPSGDLMDLMSPNPDNHQSPISPIKWDVPTRRCTSRDQSLGFCSAPSKLSTVETPLFTVLILVQQFDALLNKKIWTPGILVKQFIPRKRTQNLNSVSPKVPKHWFSRWVLVYYLMKSREWGLIVLLRKTSVMRF